MFHEFVFEELEVWNWPLPSNRPPVGKLRLMVRGKWPKKHKRMIITFIRVREQ